MSDMFLVAQFRGAQAFNDQRHAENFVKYLFSQSRGHPEMDRTRLNLITETSPEGGVLSQYLNTTPKQSCDAFLRTRMIRPRAHETVTNDGAYVMFAVKTPSGAVVSNFVRGYADRPSFTGSRDMVQRVLRYHKSAAGLSKALRALVGDGQIQDLDRVDLAEHAAADKAVHAHLMAHWPGKTLMLASHHDQREAPDCWHTNPVYHVHRLKVA